MPTTIDSRNAGTPETELASSRTSVVRVTYVAETKSLEIEPAAVYVKAGSRVSWRFRSQPVGYEPVIQFPGTASTTGTVFDTGPFESLCVSSGGITGAVGRRASGEHPYRITFVPRPGVATDILDLTAPPSVIFIGVDENPDPQSAGG